MNNERVKKLIFKRTRQELKKTSQTSSADEYYPGVAKPKSSGLIKAFGYFVAIGLIFGVGFAAGKGDLTIRQQLTSTGGTLPADLNYASVEEVYDRLKEAYDGKIDTAKLLEGVKKGLVAATEDPYSEYFNSQEAKDFSESLSGSFTGIGAELGKNSEGQIIIVSPLAGYPAEAAGLKPQDIIAAIDDKSTNGLSLSSAVRQIRGKENTKVTLTIVRNGGQPFDVTITRTRINLPSVKSEIKDGVGYMEINQFNDKTTELAKTAARDFKSRNVKGVILDLRGNPGGYLSGAVDIASLWLKEGTTVVSERRGGKVVSIEKADGSATLAGLPTVVLINAGSASASEIVAGALRDHGAAKIVGIKSFGKGSVQRIDDLAGGAQLKITIARWYTPKGKSIDKEGVNPDVTVENPKEPTSGVDPQKDKALEVLSSLMAAQ